ncbi:MAG: riboflavin biosynthesis protein RibF [Candidatus Omnitrophica bacterium]|nr:riboflavin biosynthesis protein RibF [Candidatus Omnitrophota bacterium]
MLVIEHLTQLKRLGRIKFVGTIGNFDGLHQAHRKILNDVKRMAKRKHARSLVVTFKNQTRQLRVKKTKPILTSHQHKLILLKQAGIDYCYVFPFHSKFKKLTAKQFLKDILFRKFALSHLIIGYNFRFGKGRKGTTALIKQEAKRRGIGCTIEEAITHQAMSVSSSRIRSLISQGKLLKAGRLLGRPYSVFSTVIHGAGRGTSLGFPTANLDVQSEVMPPLGVYIVKVNIWNVTQKRTCWGMRVKDCLEKKNLTGVLNLGYIPTFCGSSCVSKVPHAEVHIINFTNDLRDKFLEIIFLKKIRNEKKFSSTAALCKQIKRDIQQALSYFS